MKTLFINILTVAFLMPLSALAAIGDTFTARTEEGVLVTYKVTNEFFEEVQVGINSMNTPAVSTKQKGVVTIPSEVNGYQVTSIGRWAFHDCKYLTEVILPETIVTIERNAFAGCTMLERIVFPDGLLTIGSHAFSDDTSLTEIVIPESVTDIHATCFKGCQSLVNVELGKGMQEIPKECFYGCHSLAQIDFPDNINTIGFHSFYHCSSLERIYITDMDTIGRGAFGTCTNLIEATIGRNVYYLMGQVFLGCSKLEHVIVEREVEYIGYDWLNKCNSMKRLDMMSAYPISVSKDAFSNTILNNVALFVPKGCKERYANAPVWQNFKTIIERNETDDIQTINGNSSLENTYYTVNGVRTNMPQHGITIIRHKNGVATKVLQ